MRRYALVLTLSLMFLLGCASEPSSSSRSNTEQTSHEPSGSAVPDPEPSASHGKLLSETEYEQLYSDPEKFEGAKVDFFAQIFMDVERDGQGTYIQAFADPENSSKNTIIAIADPSLDVARGDVIHVTGVVKGEFTGTNAFGAKITAPAILADKIEKTDYATAFSPAKETIQLDKELDHNGFVVNLHKVELAEDETRVYLSITNKMQNKIRMYSHSAKLTQESKQYEPKLIIGDRYPKLQSEILPGITSDGVIVFPRIEGSSQLKLFLEGSSDNWSIDIAPFVFEIKQ